MQFFKRFRWSSGLSVVALCAVLLVCSQLRCAGADNYIEDDDLSQLEDGGDKTDGKHEDPCFSGTPRTEEQLFNRCTNAEIVERGTKIPATLWDGKSPLPYE